MDDLLFSLNIIFPLLVMMLVGYAARSLKLLGSDATRQINSCIFKIFLPLSLFFSIMDTEVGTAIDVTTLVYAFFASLVCFAALFVLVPRICPDRASCGVLIQGIARSNYAIFGIPLAMMIYPDADTSIVVLMVVVAVPVFNVLSTIALMVYGGQKPSLKGLLKGVALNPLIISTVVGFAMWGLQWSLPALVESPLRSLASLSTPLALFSLGAALDFQKARTNLRLIVTGVVGKLVVVPLIFLSAGIALGIRDVSLSALIALYATPTSVSSFPMAQAMGGNADLAGAQVVFSTAFSILTVFLWVFVLRSLGFLA